MKGKVLVALIAVSLMLSTVVISNIAIGGNAGSVTFTASGLINGTHWSIQLNTVTLQSTQNTITFTGLADGTYNYQINEVTGYRITPTTGQVTVSGGQAQVLVTFTSRTDTWWTFGGDIANTKYTTAKGPVTNSLLWSKNIGNSWAAPAIANGVLFVGSNNLMSALNARTGDTLWTYPQVSERGNSATVVNGVVYTAGSYDDCAYALNATTGTKIWSTNLGTYLPFSPAVINGLFYIGSGDNGRVYALNAFTGEIVWSFYAGVSCLFDAYPTVVNGVVYIGSGNGDSKLYALNATTGTKIWSFNTGHTIYSSPAVANGIVYFASLDGNLYAINSSTGDKIWNLVVGLTYSSPAISKGVVYIGSGDPTGICAVNATTGVKIWSYLTGGFISGGPLVADNIVYIGSADCKFYALDATTGSLIWYYTTTGRILGSATMANGVIYVGTEVDLYAFGTYTADSFTVSSSAGSGGSITPNISQVFNSGEAPCFTITPDSQHRILDVTVNGTSVISSMIGNTYTFPAIYANYNITATFAQNTCIIIPTAGAGGTITPNTVQTVNSGDTPSFTITAASENHISDVTVNGTSVLSSLVNNVYTFQPVYSNFNIAATFDLNSYNITPIEGTGGTISPNMTQTVNSGDRPSFVITPNNEYHILDVKVNGTSVLDAMNGNTYTFPSIYSNYDISVTFAKNTYSIVPSAGVGGTINPSTLQIVNSGDTLSINITANNNYRIKDVLVNGSSVLSNMTGNNFIFPPVYANYNITATFEIIPDSPSPTTSSNTPSPTVNPTQKPQPVITPSPTPSPTQIPANATAPPGDDGGNPVTSTEPETSQNMTLLDTWGLVIGSVSLLSVLGIGLTIYAIRANKRVHASATPQVTAPSPKINDYIFISHVEEDRNVVAKLVDALESSGYATWSYERNIVPGLSYLTQTSRAIEKSKAFMLVISKQSMISRQVTVEVVHAHETGKPFIPLLLNIDHAEFQAQQPEWSQVVGSSTSIQLKRNNISDVIQRIIAGLETLGIRKKNQTD